jgi:DNA-binding response OmpR family regulator
MRHPGETFSSEALISRVWKDDAVASDEAVRMAIRRIRQAIDLTSGGTDRSLIENIPRIGYRLRSN